MVTNHFCENFTKSTVCLCLTFTKKYAIIAITLAKGMDMCGFLRRNCYKFVTIAAGGKTFPNKVNAEVYSDYKGK